MKVDIRTRVFYDKDINMWVACAPALGVWSQGKDIYRAEKNLEDAVCGFLLVVYKQAQERWGFKE